MACPSHRTEQMSANWSRTPAVGEAKQTERWPSSNLADSSRQEELPRLALASDQKQEGRPARSSRPEARHERGKLGVMHDQEFIIPLQAHRLGPALVHGDWL